MLTKKQQKEHMRESLRRFRKRHPHYERDIIAKRRYREKGKATQFAMRRWSDDEIALLRDGKYTDMELVEKLNRSIGSIQTKRSRLNNARKNKHWTDEEIEILKEDKYTNKELVEKLGRPIGSIQAKRNRLKHIKSTQN